MGEPVDESQPQPSAQHEPDEAAADRSVEALPEPAAVAGVDPGQALAGLAARPLAEHAEVYEELHSHLQRTLAEIDGG